jgi:hypothetical protein
MKLYGTEAGLGELLAAPAHPSISIRSGIPPQLAPLPYWRELIKLKLRALVFRSHTRRWLQLLNSHPAFSDYVQTWPRFVHKIYRPYLSCALSMQARVAALTSHYRFVFHQGLGPVVARACRAPVLLASCEGKSGSSYQIALRAVGTQLEREGDLVLQLTSQDEILYSVAFTFAWRDGCQAVSIGCIQGGKGADASDAIRHATRELHGARPKHLMTSLVRQLGHTVGCAELRMVSNANRVVRKAIRHGRVRADYDQLWTELGATRQPDGDYRLPCAPLAAPDMAGIASKKRSEARKRHELTISLASQIGAALGCGEAPR